MKKYFFFAAMALAVMSSCSNDDVVDNPAVNPIEEDQSVAIELGLSAPQALVTTRGTGTVGSTDGNANYWNGQELHVVMYNKGANTLATEGNVPSEEGGTYIFQDLKFQAPVQDADDHADTQIKILTSDQSAIQAKYYPSTQAFDFYGYHTDDAGGTLAAETKTVSGITIDGTQDLMAAQTKEVNATNYPDATIEWDTDNTNLKVEDQPKMFSAWAARRGIQPALVFEHLLTRLQFNVIAGQASAAGQYYNDDATDWAPNQVTGTPEGATSENQSTAVFVKAIRVKNVQTDNISINLADKTISSTGAATNNLSLMGPDTNDDKELDAFAPTAPAFYGPGHYDDTHLEKTPIGESIMMLPLVSETPEDNKIELEIDVTQLVVDQESIADATPTKYVEKTETLHATVLASSIMNGADYAGKTTFAAGESYNINITVYSFQRIEVSAELTAWEEGGDINIAPGDQF